MLAEAQKSMTTKEFAIGERRRGFVGISGGLAFPVGDFRAEELARAETGFRLDLINFGYLFTENFGLASKLYYGNHDFVEQANNPESSNWKYYGLLAGPLVSGTIHRNIELAFHPMAGFSLAQLPQPKDNETSIESKVAPAFSLGTSLQLNPFSRIGFHVGLEYYYTKVKFEKPRKTYRITTLTPSLGVAFRFH